jgi:hypothetical protein
MKCQTFGGRRTKKYLFKINFNSHNTSFMPQPSKFFLGKIKHFNKIIYFSADLRLVPN